MPPGTAAGQHVDDRGEHRPLIDIPSAAALRTLLLRRDERLDDLPQLIRDQFSAQLSFPHGRTTPRRSPLIHVRQALSTRSSSISSTCSTRRVPRVAPSESVAPLRARISCWTSHTPSSTSGHICTGAVERPPPS